MARGYRVARVGDLYENGKAYPRLAYIGRSKGLRPGSHRLDLRHAAYIASTRQNAATGLCRRRMLLWETDKCRVRSFLGSLSTCVVVATPLKWKVSVVQGEVHGISASYLHAFGCLQILAV